MNETLRDVQGISILRLFLKVLKIYLGLAKLRKIKLGRNNQRLLPLRKGDTLNHQRLNE